MNEFSIKQSDKKFEYFNFFYKNTLLKEAPVAGMTLRKAGSMRFRWNEQNSNRDKVLTEVIDDIKIKNKVTNSIDLSPVELIHSHIVYDIHDRKEIINKTGDGIITNEKFLMPVVTVADCMPIFLYDVEKKVFGIVHSGWKGTGIAFDAINLSSKLYNSKPENFCVILGPHINNCCYIVNQERADFFKNNFTPDCISLLSDAEKESLSLNWDNGSGKLYRLSLLKANLALLQKAGIKEENINYCKDCTCCNEVFGSNRRETSKSNIFTVQAAFITYANY